MDPQHNFILTPTASELIKAALTGSKSVILHLLFSFLYFFLLNLQMTKTLLNFHFRPRPTPKNTKNKSLHPTDPKLPHYIPPNFICSADKDNLLRLIKKHQKVPIIKNLSKF